MPDDPAPAGPAATAAAPGVSVPAPAPGPPAAGAGAPATAGLVTVLGVAVLLAGLSLSPTGAPGAAAWPLAAAALVVGAALAWGWPLLLALPGPRGASGVVAATALVAVVVVATTPGAASLQRLPVVLGLAVLAACAHQLLRRDGRPRVVDALGGTLTGCALVVAAACWTTLPAMPGGRAVAAVTLFSALVVAVVLAPVPRSWRAVAVLALLGAALVLDAVRAAAPSGVLGGGVGLGGAVLVNVVVVCLAVGVRTVLGRQSGAGSRVRGRVAVVAVHLALLGPLAHLVAVVLA